MGLIIRSSAIHAAGCYTTSPIQKGSRVVEYTGPLIDKEDADRRYEDKPITYLFAIGDGAQVIDGHGMAMFINHSCDANCETEEIDGHVWISAIRDIAAGEEISYDYCLFDGDEQDALCNCGARNCRGSMFSPEELKRRKRSSSRRTVATAPAEKKGSKQTAERKSVTRRADSRSMSGSGSSSAARRRKRKNAPRTTAGNLTKKSAKGSIRGPK
ncbi:MAG: SET domain-containing protein-lysine N-methyltransferase [Acidobacteriaceae bacterium]